MMTRRERLSRIFQGELPDRPAVKLWGAFPGKKRLHPAYEAVYELALEKTDVMPFVHSPFDLYWGSAAEKICEVAKEPSDSDEWINIVTKVHTPEGTLKSVFFKSTVGKPGYQKE